MKRCRCTTLCRVWPLLAVAFGVGVFLSFFSLRVVLLLSVGALIILGILLSRS